MKTLVPFLLLLLGAFLTGQADMAGADESRAIIVVYNNNDPDSKALADFYCTQRSIDPSQEIGIDAPLAEEISREDYENSIATPIREQMDQRGYWTYEQNEEGSLSVAGSRIHYAVLMRGIPLKIAECTNYPGDNPNLQQPPFGNTTAASVDSELSLLGLESTQLSGVLKNPLCIQKIAGIDTGTNAPQASLENLPPQLLLVGRLDAPTPDAVKAMIVHGIEAEKKGLWGWGYVDIRSITDPHFTLGDDSIREAGNAMRKNGIPVLCDDLPDTFQKGYPVTDAAAYFGWYAENINGPFAEDAFRFVPGAVAAHLHSFSAITLREANKGWAAPLVMHGASASLGNVYEPYLLFTTDFGVFEKQLLSGANLAQSYYAAQPVLSWMSILLGDPLYRPYAAFQKRDSSEANPWSDYRAIVLRHHGNVPKAAHDLGVRAKETKMSFYLEALGAAQEAAGFFAAAGASYHDAYELEKSQPIRFRLLLEQVRVLEKRGKQERGVALLTEGISIFQENAQKGLLLAWIARLTPIKPAATPALAPVNSSSKPR